MVSHVTGPLQGNILTPICSLQFDPATRTLQTVCEYSAVHCSALATGGVPRRPQGSTHRPKSKADRVVLAWSCFTGLWLVCHSSAAHFRLRSCSFQWLDVVESRLSRSPQGL
jgi:hypothetical protein